MRRLLLPLFLAVAVSVAACGGNAEVNNGTPSNSEPTNTPTPGPTQPDPTDPTPGPVDPTVLANIRADVNRDGRVDAASSADDSYEETWDATHGATFIANIDDDSRRCVNQTALPDSELVKCNDAQDEIVNGSSDTLDLAPLLVVPWPEAPSDAKGYLELSSPGASKVRLFKKVGTSFQVFAPTTSSLSAAELKTGVTLGLEGKDIVRNYTQWDGTVDVTLRVTAAGKTSTDRVRLKVAPLLFYNHLLPSERVFVSALSYNTTFVNALDTIVKSTGTAYEPLDTTEPVSRGSDPWTQDFMETGFMSFPSASGQQVIRVTVRAPSFWSRDGRLRYAGRLAFTKFRGPDSAGLLQVDSYSYASLSTARRQADSLNSFGNLETIPPHSAGGKSWPLGRIVMGAVQGFAPDMSFLLMLESQKVQTPIYINTAWLLVGHVDETISFVRAPNARGWVALVNDPRMARNILESMVSKGYGSTKLFIGKSLSGASVEQTVSQLLANTKVMTANDEAALYVDDQLAILQEQLNLSPSEIIRVPFIHWDMDGYSVAYSPGIVNGLLINDTNYVAPDPFGPVVSGVDQFKYDLQRSLSLIGVKTHWIDDWYVYHDAIGEVHCGTNAVRAIPSAKWWEAGK